MHPTLFTLRLSGREIAFHSYGVLIAIGLALGIALAYREARRYGMDRGRVLDAAFWMIVAGLIGSRLVYGLVNAGEFARVCFQGGGPPRSFGAVLSDCVGPRRRLSQRDDKHRVSGADPVRRKPNLFAAIRTARRRSVRARPVYAAATVAVRILSGGVRPCPDRGMR